MKNTSFRLFDIGWLTAIIIMVMILFANNRNSLGDVNNDGSITVQDIIRIVGIILEHEPAPTDYELWASDVNNDDSTDIADIIVLVELIMGFLEECPDLHHVCEYNLSECCVDTTTGLFTFRHDTFGVWGSMVNGIQIIDENNIWAATHIIPENAYNFYDVSNAIRWNGEGWEEFVLVDSTCDFVVFPTAALPVDVYYVSEDNIFFPEATKIFHWDGNSVTNIWGDLNFDTTQKVYRVHGISDSSIFFYGKYGAIVHFNGDTTYTMNDPIENIKFKDCDGSEDGEYVFFVGYNITGNSGGDDNLGLSIALQYHNEQWDTLFYDTEMFGDLENDIYGMVTDVEVYQDTAYFKTVEALIKYNYLTTEMEIIPSTVFDYNWRDLFVNAPNDMFFITAYNHYLHFNGHNWTEYDSFATPNWVPDYYYSEYEIRGDVFVGGGSNNYQWPAFNALMSVGNRRMLHNNDE